MMRLGADRVQKATRKKWRIDSRFYGRGTVSETVLTCMRQYSVKIAPKSTKTICQWPRPTKITEMRALVMSTVQTWVRRVLNDSL